MAKNDPRTVAASKQVTIAIVSSVVIVAISLYSYFQTARAKKSKDIDEESRDSSPRSGLDKQFHDIARTVRSVPSLSKRHQLQLYSMFKQATAGPCTGPSPSMLNIVAKTKYEAWKELGDMPQNVAKMLYIGLATDIMSSAVDPDNDVDPDMDDDIFMQAFGGAPTTSTLLNHVDETNAVSEESLHAAAMNGDAEILQQLLESSQQDPNVADDSGQSPLHMAADRGHIRCVSILLDAGANPKAVDVQGISVLHAAVIGEHIEACRLLLDRGADPDQADVDGDTARAWAINEGSDEMKEVFKPNNV